MLEDVERLKCNIEGLRSVANRLDELVDSSQPYSLHFYYDSEEPLTQSQKEKLESFLAYNFHKIWANTWLHIESDHIRKLIGDKPRHL